MIKDSDEVKINDEQTQSRVESELSVGEENSSAESISEKQVVALRPVWKVIIACLIGAICLCAIYNLVHTFSSLKHPKVLDKKSLTSFATDMDTSWYKTAIEARDNQLDVQKQSLANGKSKVSEQLLDVPSQATTEKKDEEERKAMAAPISSNQITAEVLEAKLATEPRENTNPENNSSLNILERSAKEETPMFEKNHSPYTLQAGTIIPGILITGINSSLPGQVLAQVRAPVFDSISGKHLLIPQGSKLVGNYESKICFGQKRLFLIWQRIILPSGDSIHLGGMPGSSLEGYSGFKDKVDSHYGALLKSALLMSILSTGSKAAGPTNTESNSIGPELLAQSIGLQFAETGSQFISKSMEVEPTLTIRPGYLFNITVTKDIIFSGPYSE